jgi:hypothetical protein
VLTGHTLGLAGLFEIYMNNQTKITIFVEEEKRAAGERSCFRYREDYRNLYLLYRMQSKN